MTPTRIPIAHLTKAQATQIVDLWNRTWPDRTTTFIDFWEHAQFSDPKIREMLHCIFDDDTGKLMAVGRSFYRTVRFLDHKLRQTVLALASVCVEPEFRGRGYGRDVVSDAFVRLEVEPVDVCLFQTSVPEFYEKFECKSIDNWFVNRKSDQPDESPWWEDHCMILGPKEYWTDGVIDLNGAGY